MLLPEGRGGLVPGIREKGTDVMVSLFAATKCAVCGGLNSDNGLFRLRRACEQKALFEATLTNQKMQAVQNSMEARSYAFPSIAPYQQYIASTGPSDPLAAPKPLPSAGMKVEDLIGWRIWRLKNGYLTAFSQNYVWVPGEVAEGVPGDHDPQGIWAFKTPRRAIIKMIDDRAPHVWGSQHVWGSVKLWGSVVEHAEGYRASKARIVSLEGATDTVTDEAFERLCRRYGVQST